MELILPYGVKAMERKFINYLGVKNDFIKLI